MVVAISSLAAIFIIFLIVRVVIRLLINAFEKQKITKSLFIIFAAVSVIVGIFIAYTIPIFFGKIFT